MSADAEQARAEYVRAYDAARDAGDVEAMGEAALGLAATRIFGTHPGRAPAFLHQAYQRAEGALRVRLAVALAKSWVYGGSAQRAVPFADEAVDLATRAGDPSLLAEALDAQLLVHWGPDDQTARIAITAQLEDVVAHLEDVEARLSAYLWRLTTAMECLDMAAVRRQLRALDILAEETDSDRVRFFATARQGMNALLAGDFAAAEELRRRAVEIGERAGEPDSDAIEHALLGMLLRQAPDRDRLLAEAEVYEQFGTSEGVLSVLAEAAQLFRVAGDRERTALIAERFSDLGRIPRDVDWLLTVCMVTDAAAGAGLDDLARQCVDALEPYAGRGLVNAGGVSFLGVVDSYLAFACRSLGRDDEAARWSESAHRLYVRFGAPWWISHGLHQAIGSTPARTASSVATLRPGADGVWLIGTGESAVAVREMRGFVYLRMLVRQPGVAISALDLSDWAAGHAGRGIDEAPTGPVVDDQALAIYRRRIVELDAELAEAAEWADVARRERLVEERALLLDEVAAATGLGGRQRQVGGSAERARVAVRKALAAATERIAAVDPALGRHLRDAVQTGSTCCYEPDPSRPTTWITQ